MMTIISGTNRVGSMTLRVAQLYQQMISIYEPNVKLLSLEGMNVWERHEGFLLLEREILIPSEKFLFVMPEYNGSFPGILKMLIDNSDIRKCWWHKKAAIVGVADGRGGNLRGIDHLTGILHYMRMNVLYNKLPLSRINDEISPEGVLLKPATEAVIRHQIDEFLKY
ncbi:MAG: NAD(P)H-dependent oxidoreductase [Bacteroidetes bacterium]|nr:NAD(P)H-dependent oxidoreductase [Bacteroidota bacterium]MBS1739810.1 NAD(P)H-dependent oxidoreductase [Bacteroidota bacterium]MBS1775950.1 NAD(P)H-dependent oxidoreductase [Bacteroidota bacterium]